MNTRALYPALVAAILLLGSAPDHASEMWWHYFAIPHALERGAWLTFGVDSGATSGFDGVQPVAIEIGAPRLWMLLYREQSPAWTGPTGFYAGDIEPPLRPGEQRTWSDIYFWAVNYTPPPEGVEVIFVPDPGPPVGSSVRLFIDEVPEGVEWDGPWEFDLRRPVKLLLPIAEVSNPLDGTRMHITVTAVPEPSGLLALLSGTTWLLALESRRRGQHTLRG